MNKRNLLLMLILTLPILIRAQEVKIIDNIRYSVGDDQVVINYDFVPPTDTIAYVIDLIITTQDGDEIIPESIFGDFGENVSPGLNKRIDWNYTQDDEEIDSTIRVEIIARRADDHYRKRITLSQAMFRSTILPGWGIESCGGRKIAMFFSVGGYGLLFGSVFFNTAAVFNYEKYRREVSSVEKSDDILAQAKRQYKVATPIAIGAVVVWGVNYFFTYKQYKKMQKSNSNISLNPQNNKINVVSHYQPEIRVQSFGLRYNF